MSKPVYGGYWVPAASVAGTIAAGHASPNCAISHISLDPTGPVAVCLTDDAHLAADRGSHTIFDAPKEQAP